MNQPENTLYYLHRLALKPITGQLTRQETIELLENICNIGTEDFFEFIQKNGLVPLWLEFLSESKDENDTRSLLLEKTRERTLNIAAQQLMQENILQQTQKILDKCEIPYLVFKGCDLRRSIYDNPTLRPSADIDILIYDEDKSRAINQLTSAGFNFLPKTENISHEATLVKSSTSVDLHWHIMRPGRTRIDMANFLFANRQKRDSYWGMNISASLVVMLVHPVFTKHLNHPVTSMLIHIVDLQRLITHDDVDWDLVIQILEESGTCTAAWCSIIWLELITEISINEEVKKRIAPGRLHQRYIRLWIDHYLTERLQNYPFLIRGLFSLAIQDSMGDAARAMRSLATEKRLKDQHMRELENR